MANEFNKEERVAFEMLLEGFEDALLLSKHVRTYKTDQVMMERTNDVIWRPMPYISQSFEGTDQTGNFKEHTQLSVPARISFSRSVPWTMTARELRDSLQEKRLGDAAKQKLSSDVNTAIMNLAALQGTLVVKRTSPASGFDDVALCEAIMNEQGIASDERFLALSTRDYNGMASNLQQASRSFGNKKTDGAYERAYVGRVASFDTMKLDWSVRKKAAAGGALTVDTTSNGPNNYVPKATTTAITGETANVDNRYQTIAVSDSTGVEPGDALTIDGVYAVHHITKINTGQLKTFRVVDVPNATSITISPPLITNRGNGQTDAAACYQNVEVDQEAADAAINWLNTADCYVNPFWHADAIELLPGRYAVPTNAGTAVIRGSTSQGVELVMQKWYDINTMRIKYRLDTLFGVCNKQPEMSGCILFGQV